jgi:hypothetical protein
MVPAELPVDDLDSTLQRIADEAERIAPCPLAVRVHGEGEQASLAIEPAGLALRSGAIVLGRRPLVSGRRAPRNQAPET